MSRCLMCSSRRVALQQSINTRDLVRGYARVFHIDVSRFFPMPAIELLHCESCDLRFFDPPVTGDVKFYRQLSRDANYYMDDKPEFAIARDYIGRGDAVLEIGGGRGGFASHLTEVDYTGLEFNDEAIETAARRGVRLLGESLEAHAATNGGKYDVVCAFQVLEHVATPRRLLEDALVCLKPGGRLVFSVPSGDSFLSAVPDLYLNMPPHHVTLWSDQLLLNAAEMLNCRMESLVHEKIAGYHYGWFLATALRCAILPSVVGTFEIEPRPLRRAASLAAAIAGRIAAFLSAPIFKRLPKEMLPNGHAVVAVMRKPEALTEKAL